MCMWEGFHDAHTLTHTRTQTRGNQHTGRMYSNECSHTPTHTHTHTHTHIDIGTMGLPSLETMGVWGASFLASHVCWGGGGGA